jgi:aspartate/methionine/tyrosine aminotransferase
MRAQSTRPVPVASRVNRFSYAIRNIVAEAKAVEARGTRVRYLNIGDPVAFGFQTPAHLIEAASRAMRDGQNGYLPSAGIASAREAVAAEYARRGLPTSPDRVLVTTGTSEGIELALNALVDEGDDVLVPSPTYPLYTAVLAKIGARASYYRTDPARDWLPDLDHIRSLITPRTRGLVVIDPNNPTGAVYPAPVRRALIDLAERHELTILADEVYGDVGFDGPLPLLGTIDPDAPIISFSSLSKAYLAPGWRAGWLVVSATPRLDDALTAIKKLADGRLCSPGPMQHAIPAALEGDRSHQQAFRAALAERGRLTTEMLNAIPGMHCVPPRAAFYAMPRVMLPPGRTDEHYILSLLRETGILCVYGSGFGMPAEDGYFRIVFLATPAELSNVYADIGAFTSEYLRRG